MGRGQTLRATLGGNTDKAVFTFLLQHQLTATSTLAEAHLDVIYTRLLTMQRTALLFQPGERVRVCVCMCVCGCACILLVICLQKYVNANRTQCIDQHWHEFIVIQLMLFYDSDTYWRSILLFCVSKNIRMNKYCRMTYFNVSKTVRTHFTDPDLVTIFSNRQQTSSCD